MSSIKNSATRFQPGQSGNPKGKPPGSGKLQKLRAAVEKHVPEIIDQLVNSAKAGDVQAARLLMERVFPPVKPVEQAQQLALPQGGSLTDQGRAVLTAIADGQLAPGQGAQLLAAIGALARVTEIDELTDRVTKLEEHHANK